MGKLDLSYIAGGHVKWYRHCGFLGQLDDLKKQHAVGILTGNHTLRHFCRETKTYIHTKICIQMFISAGSSDGKDSTYSAADLALIPGLGRPPGGGHGDPLQYSCLENPVGRGAWWATSHGVTQSDTSERLNTNTAQTEDSLDVLPWVNS